MFTKQRLDNYIKDQDALMALAEEYIGMVGGSKESVNSIDLDEDGLSIETTYYCCGSSETDYYTMPIEYLMKENWREIELERQADEKEAKRLQAEADERKRKEEAERKEYEKFLELKEKYE